MTQLTHVHGTVTVEIGAAKHVAEVAVAFEVRGPGGTVVVHEVKARIGDVWLPAEGALYYAVVSAMTAGHQAGTLSGENGNG